MCIKLLTLLKCMVDIEKCQVVSINVCEPHLGLIRSLLGVTRPHKALRY